jgi:hypothetical protein
MNQPKKICFMEPAEAGGQAAVAARVARTAGGGIRVLLLLLSKSWQ